MAGILSKDALLRLRLQGDRAVLQSLQQVENALDRIRAKAARPLVIPGLPTIPGGGGGGPVPIPGIAPGGGGGFSPGGTGGSGRPGAQGGNNLKGILSPFGDTDLSRLTVALAGLNAFKPEQFLANAQASLRLAAGVRSVTEAFQGVSKTVGQDWVQALGAARGATQGQISDMNIMQGLMRLQAQGLDISAEKFGHLASQAIRLGAAFGEDAADSVDKLIRGITRLEPNLLDNIGIIVRLEQVTENWARKTGKAAADITEQEKQAELLAEVLKQADAAVQRIGASQDDLALRLNRSQAAWENFTDSIAKRFPHAVGMLKSAGQAFSTTSGTVIGFGAEGAVSRTAAQIEKAGITGLAGGFLTASGMRLLGANILRLILVAIGAGIVSAGVGTVVTGGLGLASLVGGSLLSDSDTSAGGRGSRASLRVGEETVTYNTIVQASINVPVRDAQIDAAGRRIGSEAAVAIRRRMDDVERGLQDRTRREVNNLLPATFVG